MEVHWASESAGLSTFVGGRQGAVDGHASAFGREIGAAAGFQFQGSDSRAYRILVAQKFQNDLDAPVQQPKIQFELNVRF